MILLRPCVTSFISILFLQVGLDAQRNTETHDDSVIARPASSRIADCGTTASEKRFEMSSKGGRRIELYLCDGSMVYGDLLAANDSALFVYAYPEFSYSSRLRIRSGSHQFGLNSICKAVIKGRSQILQDVFIGFLGGMVAGAVMTRIVERHSFADNLVGPGVLGGLGLIMGGTIGYLSSDNDLEITKFRKSDLQILNILSRHPKSATR